MSAAQPAGRSSVTVGDVRSTLLPDGYHRCDPRRTFPDSTDEDWQQHADLLDDHGRIVMTMGALLVELASGHRVLLDVGFGPRTLILREMAMEFWGGRLLASLAACGLAPDDIDVVAYSHLHLDHVGWTTPRRHDATPTFPRARHVITRAEWEHWTSTDAPGGPGAADIAVLAERAELVDGEITVLPGLDLVPTPGHTPGHASFLVSSGRHRAVVLGDAIHCPLQISHPEWAFVADANPAAAVSARRHLLGTMASPDTITVGAHFPDAIFGRVLPGAAGSQVLFDVVAPGTGQAVAPEAPADATWLPPLR